MSGTAASGGNGPDAAFGDIFDSFVDDLDLDLDEELDFNVGLDFNMYLDFHVDLVFGCL